MNDHTPDNHHEDARRHPAFNDRARACRTPGRPLLSTVPRQRHTPGNNRA